MEKPSKRGKIPPQDWPSIITRYQSGETLASIARTYDCSPPAISYIVSRSRARNATAEGQGAAPPQEPQLVKNHSGAELSRGTPSAEETSTDSPPAEEKTVSPLSAEDGDAGDAPAKTPDELRLFPDDPPVPSIVRNPSREREDTAAERRMERPNQTDPSSNGNMMRAFGGPGGAPPNLEPRRTLHLSLSGGDGGHRQDPHSPAPPHPVAGAGERTTAARQVSGQGARPGIDHYTPAGNGTPTRAAPEQRPTKEGGAFIDQALRERVDGDIAAFLAAFDAALAQDSAESRTGLREATDRLLRAGARTRIELERLEARVPLVPREKSGQETRAFRPR